MITHNGYIIKPVKSTPSQYHIVTEGRGGKIPLALDGTFTTKEIAMKFIDLYLKNKGK